MYNFSTQTVQNEIAQFEANRKKLGTHSLGAFYPGAYHQDSDVSESGAKLISEPNDKYIRGIQKRLDEKAVAREQREKKLQRFMIDQMKAHEAKEVKLLVFISSYSFCQQRFKCNQVLL